MQERLVVRRPDARGRQVVDMTYLQTTHVKADALVVGGDPRFGDRRRGLIDFGLP